MSKLPSGNSGDDFGRELTVLQDDGVQVSPEGGLNRGNEFFLDFDEGGECAGQRGQNASRVVESAQDGLRAFGEAFAFGV